MKLTMLTNLCTILQIAGLWMVVVAKQLPSFTPVLIGIAGFASIVKFLIPDAEGFDKTLRPIAAIAGFGLIIIACTICTI